MPAPVKWLRTLLIIHTHGNGKSIKTHQPGVAGPCASQENVDKMIIYHPNMKCNRRFDNDHTRMDIIRRDWSMGILQHRPQHNPRTADAWKISPRHRTPSIIRHARRFVEYCHQEVQRLSDMLDTTYVPSERERIFEKINDASEDLRLSYELLEHANKEIYGRIN